MNVEEVKRRLLRDIETLRSSKGYLNAGYPRYNTLFGRDSLICAWQMLKIDPSIAWTTLRTLAGYQGKKMDPMAEEEPGKILHEYRFDPKKQAELLQWHFPYYGSVDSTPLFILVAGKYLQQTGDKTFLSRLWNHISAALSWMRDYGDLDGDGYLEYERKNPYGLFHQGWKDGARDHLRIKPPVAIVEAQGYMYAAYQSLIYVAEELGKDEISAEVSERSDILRKNFNVDFWMEGKRYFTLALDGEKKQRRGITSNPGHLLFTGIVAQDKIEPLISRLFQPDLWTAYGIRTHSSEELDFDPYSYHTGSVWPHDNWIIYKGLMVLGFDRQADQIKKAMLRAFGELGKIPELYAVVDDRIVDLSHMEGVLANPLEAWSSAGLLEMIWED